MRFVFSALSLVGLWVSMFALTSVVYRSLAQRRALDVTPPPGVARELFARLAAGLVPAAVPILLFSGSLAIGGRSVPTLRVSVFEGGAAQRDGLREGDRLVAVDGQRTSTWEAARSALSAAHAREQQSQNATARQIRIEREGEELTLAVIPDARGHIGVSPITAVEPVSVGEALTEGVKYQLRIPAELFRIPRDDHADLVGPIGIVRETGRRARSALFDFFVFVAGIGCWLTPACILGHLFDAATLRWFLAVNPEALTLDEEVRRRFRVARLRQLLLLLLAWCGCGLLLYTASVVPAFAIACAAWFGPLLTPVSWLLTREVRGRANALLLLIGLGVPFLNLFLLWRLSLEARLYLRNRGIQVRWFRRQGEHGGLPPG